MSCSKQSLYEDMPKVKSIEYPLRSPGVKIDEIGSIEKPLMPPGVDEEHSKAKLTHRKIRILSPSLTEEIYAKLLGEKKPVESPEKERPMARSMSAVLGEHTNKYHELLAKHYGYIPPRKNFA